MFSTFQKIVLLSSVLSQDSLQVASHRAENAEELLSRPSNELAGLRLRQDLGVSAPGDDFLTPPGASAGRKRTLGPQGSSLREAASKDAMPLQACGVYGTVAG